MMTEQLEVIHIVGRFFNNMKVLGLWHDIQGSLVWELLGNDTHMVTVTCGDNQGGIRLQFCSLRIDV